MRRKTTTTEFACRGAIARIRIRNFMTYDDTELRPGPNLNMILGPNGTGKSAIVCCVIVGLAGEVTLTGRGGSPADFVKKNTDWGSTEIELHNDNGPNYIIERKITITNRSQFKIDHKSEWKINRKTALKADVQKLTKELNIKVDNLCQFLPQDSVTQFVKMNNSELLVNTLKAIGDNQLVEDHQKLIDYTKEVKEKRFALDNLNQAFKENEVNAKRLEAEVKQIQQRRELSSQKEICKQKIYYVKYLEQEKKCEVAQKERKVKEKEYKEIESKNQPLLREISLNKDEVDKFRRCIDQSQGETKRVLDKIQETQTAIENRKIDCQEEFSKFKGKESAERERGSKLRLKQQELDSLECKLNEIRNVDCSREIKKTEQELEANRAASRKCFADKHAIEDEVRSITTSIENIKREISLIQAVKEKKTNLLKSRYHDSYLVLEWYAKNKHRFKKTIFLPIFCEINVKDPRFNSIIEHAISRQELISFVCQTDEDLRLFTRSVRDELHIRFNVILAPTKTMEEFESESLQIERMANLGIKATLKDLIDAPEPIMRYLCGTLAFHKIPVAEGCTEIQLKRLQAICPKFYVGNEFNTVSKSRYDRQTIAVNEKIREAQHLIYSLDRQRLEAREKLLREKQAEYEKVVAGKANLISKEDNLKREFQVLADKHKEFKDKHDEKKRIETQITRCRERLESYNSEKIDIEVERRKLQQSIDKISRQIMNILETLVSLYGDYVKVRELHMSNLLMLKLAERIYKIAQAKYNDTKRNTSKLAEEIRKRGKALEEMYSILDVLHKEVKQNVTGFKKGKLDSITKKRFDNIKEDTTEALQAKVDELTARIQMIYSDSHNSIMSEYNRQTSELEDKRIRINELETRVNTIDTLLNDIKATWMPKLEEVIEVVDGHYRDFMHKLKYDGRVQLDYDVTKPNNFADYGIKILVRYRDNEELIPLSSTRQSGGERSVATMIYMLALQTKTSVPFRCVDEINQGMDKENERKVFELLVETADSSSSQYFLVSPKLLSNLPYSEKMKIHVVFNGKKLNLAWNEE